MRPESLRPAAAGPHVTVHVAAARAAEQKGRQQQARVHFENALRAMRAPDDATIAASLLRWIGCSHRAEGNAAAALDCFQASLTVARLHGQRHDIAHALNWIGIIHQDRGRLDQADRLFAMALRAARRARDRRIFAMVEQNLGINFNIRGNLAEALRHYRRALECYQKLGEKRFIAQVLNVLGMLYTDLRRWRAAERAFQQSSALCAELGDTHTSVMVEVNRAELFVIRGWIQPAREACNRALRLARRLRQKPALGEVYRWYGVVHRETGDYGRAQRYLGLAYRIAISHDMPLLQAESRSELAQLFRAQGHNRDALQALLDSRRIFKELQAQRDVAELGHRLADIETQFLDIVHEWAESIESKDRNTHGHCSRVAQYSIALAKRLKFDEDVMEWFHMGAYLHDVGKTHVPIEILNKPGKLTAEEWEIMKQHTTAGDAIVAQLDFPWDIRPLVRSHHEAWDGSGYPDGLKGEEIPLSARILCVVDMFDALTSTRPYRPALSLNEALAIMEESAGTKLDPQICSAFCNMIRTNAFSFLTAAA